jgi:hypothetical protein
MIAKTGCSRSHMSVNIPNTDHGLPGIGNEWSMLLLGDKWLEEK